MKTLYVAMAIGVGLLVPLQASMNARLMRELGHPFLGGLVNFVIGFAALALTALALRVPFPDPKTIAVPWWAWLGGLCGASFVIVSAASIGKIEASLLVACLVLGNLGAALVFDHFGWMGLPVRPLNAERLLGAGLLIAGVIVLSRSR